jgi:hypothetical protein
MAANVIDLVGPLMQRVRTAQTLAGGEDIAVIDRTQYLHILISMIAIATVMKQISAAAPLVTDAVWANAFDHALDTVGNQSWQPIVDRDIFFPNGRG